MPFCEPRAFFKYFKLRVSLSSWSAESESCRRKQLYRLIKRTPLRKSLSLFCSCSPFPFGIPFVVVLSFTVSQNRFPVLIHPLYLLGDEVLQWREWPLLVTRRCTTHTLLFLRSLSALHCATEGWTTVQLAATHDNTSTTVPRWWSLHQDLPVLARHSQRGDNQRAQHHQCLTTAAPWHVLSALPPPHMTCWSPKVTYCSSPTVITFKDKPMFEPFLLTQVKTLPFYPASCPSIYVNMGIHQGQ